MTLRTSIITVALILIAIPSAVYSQGAGPQLIPDTARPPGVTDCDQQIPGQQRPRDPNCRDCNFRTGNMGFGCIPLYLSYLIRFAFGLAGGFAVIEIMKGGYEYAFSGLQQFGGLPDKEAGKKRVTNAILGLIVVVFTYLIIDTIVAALFAP